MARCTCCSKKLTGQESTEIMREAETLVTLNHPNIVRFFGLYSKDEEDYLVMEYFSKGSVLDLLIQSGPSLSQNARIEIILSAARGMAYLETKNVLHLDLSARNVLVTKVDGKFESKVADFGLSRLQRDNEEKLEGPVPIRWSSPEVLSRKGISSKCDVWSFGVTMWEVYSNGVQPFNDLPTGAVITAVLNGVHLPRSPLCSEGMYAIMVKCWCIAPELRPTFKELVHLLQPFQDSKIEKTISTDELDIPAQITEANTDAVGYKLTTEYDRPKSNSTYSNGNYSNL